MQKQHGTNLGVVTRKSSAWRKDGIGILTTFWEIICSKIGKVAHSKPMGRKNKRYQRVPTNDGVFSWKRSRKQHRGAMKRVLMEWAQFLSLDNRKNMVD
jgi:hypothetical protein